MDWKVLKLIIISTMLLKLASIVYHKPLHWNKPPEAQRRTGIDMCKWLHILKERLVAPSLLSDNAVVIYSSTFREQLICRNNVTLVGTFCKHIVQHLLGKWQTVSQYWHRSLPILFSVSYCPVYLDLIADEAASSFMLCDTFWVSWLCGKWLSFSFLLHHPCKLIVWFGLV